MIAESPYTIDGLELAIDELGLKENVRVDWHPRIEPAASSLAAGFTAVNARYERFDPFHFGHVISVSWLAASLEQVNAWLWHELTHAAQVEDAGSFWTFNAEYQRQRREFAYMDAPYERWAWHVQRQAEAGKVPTIVRHRRPKVLILSDGTARVNLDLAATGH